MLLVLITRNIEKLKINKEIHCKVFETTSSRSSAFPDSLRSAPLFRIQFAFD